VLVGVIVGVTVGVVGAEHAHIANRLGASGKLLYTPTHDPGIWPLPTTALTPHEAHILAERFVPVVLETASHTYCEATQTSGTSTINHVFPLFTYVADVNNLAGAVPKPLSE